MGRGERCRLSRLRRISRCQRRRGRGWQVRRGRCRLSGLRRISRCQRRRGRGWQLRRGRCPQNRLSLRNWATRDWVEGNEEQCRQDQENPQRREAGIYRSRDSAVSTYGSGHDTASFHQRRQALITYPRAEAPVLAACTTRTGARRYSGSPITPRGRAMTSQRANLSGSVAQELLRADWLPTCDEARSAWRRQRRSTRGQPARSKD